MLKIPDSMYSKGPKNNPSPGKSWDTSGSRAYGDSDIRMLQPMPKPDNKEFTNQPLKLMENKKCDN
jgi:hypothetical protein